MKLHHKVNPLALLLIIVAIEALFYNSTQAPKLVIVVVVIWVGFAVRIKRKRRPAARRSPRRER